MRVAAFCLDLDRPLLRGKYNVPKMLPAIADVCHSQNVLQSTEPRSIFLCLFCSILPSSGLVVGAEAPVFRVAPSSSHVHPVPEKRRLQFDYVYQGHAGALLSMRRFTGLHVHPTIFRPTKSGYEIEAPDASRISPPCTTLLPGNRHIANTHTWRFG